MVRTEALLDRYGVLTRGEVAAEGIPGGFSAVYPVLRQAEDAGRCRRGYFVEGLGAAQFGLSGAVDRLRSLVAARTDSDSPVGAGDLVPPSAGAAFRTGGPSDTGARGARGAGARGIGARGAGNEAEGLVLAATDPANPYGAALQWPERPPATEIGEARRGHQAGRKAGAVVVLVDGALALYVERGGRRLLCYTDDEQTLALAAGALAAGARSGALGTLHVESADGDPVAGSVLGQALADAGFRTSPRGLRLRA